VGHPLDGAGKEYRIDPESGLSPNSASLVAPLARPVAKLNSLDLFVMVCGLDEGGIQKFKDALEACN